MFLLIPTTVLFFSLLSSTESMNGINYQVTIRVDTETGNDESCVPPYADTPCASLEAIANGIESLANLTSLEIVIVSSNLVLREPVLFDGLSLLSVIGAPTHIRCVSSTEAGENVSAAGVMFVDINALHFQDVTLEHCGTVYNYPSYWEGEYWKSFKAALHVYNSTNVRLTGVGVTSSSGAGLAVSNVNNGTVNISDSLFEHNAIPESDRDSHSGGQGILVQIHSGENSTLMVHNCTFLNNTASTTNDFFYANAHGSIVVGRGEGGGLLVRLLGGSTNNTLVVSHSNFIRNSALSGGGIKLHIQNQSSHNLLVIKNSYFAENGCEEGSESWSGGGLELGCTFDENDRYHANGNMYILKDSVFVNNCAEIGGGAAFYSSRSQYLHFNNRVYFTNCSWIENYGHIGAAVDFSPHSDQRLLSGFLPRPVLTDCNFTRNGFSFRGVEKGESSGAGTLFSSIMDIAFNSSVLFEQNTGSALIVVDSVVDFSLANATFINNTGIQGGAISLVGVSSMVIGPGRAYKFLYNKATDRGGAISSYLIDEHDFAASRSCFLQHSGNIQPALWNSTVVFIGNEAPVGKSIFTTTITPCLLSAVILRHITNFNKTNFFNPKDVFDWLGVYFDDENHIATDGSHFKIFGQLPLEIVPGEEYLLPVNITDDFGQTVDALYRAAINEQNTTVVIDEGFSYVEDKNVQLIGHVGDKASLFLQFVNPRKTSTYLPIVLVSCPIGFSLSEENRCECDISSYEGFTECDAKDFAVYIRQGFWAGYVEGRLTTGLCPIDFCQYSGARESTDILLPQTSSHQDLVSFICGPSRTGVLCGECRQGYSAYYHSPYYTCQKNHLCSIGWLFFILSELVPATILFVIVLLLNIRFTSGKLNGFILFTQLLSTLFVNATDVIRVPDGVRVIGWGYEIIYGFFSLDFFTIEPLSFCLWEGATVLDVLAFKYVTVAYSLILVILVIVFMRYFAHRLLWKCVKISSIQISVIHGLSAFLVVCYMQCIKVSLELLLSYRLQGKGGRLLYPARVWFSAEIEIFSPEHLPYAIPALLCLLGVGVIPPILLTVYPLNYKIAAVLNISGVTYPRLTRVLRMLSLEKLKPILDSFQGCFKDNLRFFAGVYFAYRWIGLLVYSLSPNFATFYASMQAMLIFVILIHTTAQPYAKRKYNVIDGVLLSDLALINLLTTFNYYYTRVTAEEVRDQRIIDTTTSIQLILIYLPIIAMCVYIVIEGCKRCRRKVSAETYRMSTEDSPEMATAVGSVEDLPARMQASYTELDSVDEPSHPALPPNIPPAYI